MKLKLLMTMLLVTSFFFISNAEEKLSMLAIVGDNTTCTEEVYSYSVTFDPAVYYEWTITNGAFITSPVGSHTVDVAWYDSGTITVSTYSDSGMTILVNTASMSVSVDVLDPYITMDPEVGCLDEKGHSENVSNPQQVEDECHKACEDNPIKYFSNGNAGSTFTWQVIGDANITLNTSSQLNVTWQSVGFGVVRLTETSVNGCVEVTEICVEIIPKPEAKFDVIPGLTVCVGQTVYFEDLSQAIGDADLTAWEWSVSDGTFQAYTESTDFSHIFINGGSYAVNLRVYNTCGCYDDYKVEIKVIAEPGPEIFCPKVVCPNEKTKIYTSSNCGTYNWVVDNGTIVSGFGTSSIEVMWNDVPGGVGYVYLSTPCGACTVPSVLEIPIVSTSLDIEGPLEVCLGDQVTLTAPMIPGTFYDWNVYSSPSSAFIVQEIHNQVIIQVTNTAPITVEVVYNNELAGCGDGCGGEATHTMIAVAPSSINGLEEVCVGDSNPYSIVGPATGNIKVELPNGGTTFSGNGSNFNFTMPGIHIFTPANAGCEGPPLLVNVHEIPPPADYITGPTDVCPGIPYVYEAGNDVDGTIYSWTVTNGTPATGVGKEITVTWNPSGSYSLDVTRINIQTPNCESAPISLNVNPLSISPNISGPTSVCANEIETYSLDYLDGEEYNWTIALEEQGSVITDPNSSSVDILWNNTTGSAVVTGSVRKCNVWYDIPLNVVIDPVTNVSFSVTNNLICQNDNITFTATTGFNSYYWTITPMFGLPLSTLNSFNRIFTEAGTFVVTLVATDFCGNISTHSETITVLPEPPAVLSITANTLECTGGVVTSGSATLVTTVIGGTAGYTFDWSRNSFPFGSGLPSEVITDVGLYRVTVTDTSTPSMCSKVLTLKVKCPTSNCTMPITNTGGFNFTYDNITCGEVTFNETFVNTAPGWTFTGGTYKHNGPNAFTAPGPTYTYSSFDNAGYYNVGYELCYNHPINGDCCNTVGVSVPIPVVAEAKANAFCDNTGAYMIKLDDFSSSLGNLAGYNVEWFINGTSVSSMTGVTSGTTTVPLGGLTPGSTYPVELKVFVPFGSVPGMSGNYQCEFATTVVIPAFPDASFTHNAPVCEDLDVEFIAALNSPNSTYYWEFGDGAELIQINNTAARKYDGPMGGGYNVTLTVTNAAGCIDTDNANLNVVTNDFDSPAIDVTPMTPICKPNPATLTFGHLGTATATIFDWSDGAAVNPNVVFDAGGYIVTVADAFGCEAVTDLTPVDIRPAPNAFIFGESSYCYGADLPVRLFGYAGPGLTYQWRKKQNGGSWFFYSTADNVSDNAVYPWGSPYMYELTVTDPATGCSATTMTTVEVHALPPAPTVTNNVVNCNPYTINLQATTPVSPAYFNWSNGATGSSINVMHGGLFEVTLTDGNGCSNTRQVDIEGEPNLDFFPVGCYVYCREDMPLFYPGPYGFFDSWRLYRDANVVQFGTGAITNLAITDQGKYWLEVYDNGCAFKTGILQVEFDEKKCDMVCEKKCEIKLGKINPEHIIDCMYEFSVDVYLGECTDIIDYQWLINDVPVPGGAVMSHVFGGPGGSYKICVVVTGEDDFGNKCKEKVCFEFSPTCKCDCDVIADFEIEKYGCEYIFIAKPETSKCTKIEDYVWTISYDGKVFEQFSEEKFSYGFNFDFPVEVCLIVYGNDGTLKCKDKICKTIWPCNGDSAAKIDHSNTREGEVDIPSIAVSPNPVSDKLRIVSKGNIGTEWHIVVIDLNGRVISNSTIEIDSPLLIMSTDGWKNGMYQIAISDELGNRFIQKVIKID